MAITAQTKATLKYFSSPGKKFHITFITETEIFIIKINTKNYQCFKYKNLPEETVNQINRNAPQNIIQTKWFKEQVKFLSYLH